MVKNIKVTKILPIIIAAIVLFLVGINYNSPFFVNNFIRWDNFAKFILLFLSLNYFLITLYCLGEPGFTLKRFLFYTVFYLISISIIIQNNLIGVSISLILLSLFLSLLLKKDINHSNTHKAKTTFIILGIGDLLFIIGILLLIFNNQLLQFNLIKINLDINSNLLQYLTFLTLIFACLTKVGAIPLHSWIPALAEISTSSLMAFLPASLYKLIGIYLFSRVMLETFIINNPIKLFMMTLGVITIIYGVVIALMQSNPRKLLCYHTISQAGYIVLGISSGSSIGIAGGIFHAINSVIYKSNLFLTTSILLEHFSRVKKTTHYEGNEEAPTLILVKPPHIPLLLISIFIAIMAISGLPPFNGYISKDLIFRALQGQGTVNQLYTFMTLIGSSLTIASFTKFAITILSKDIIIIKKSFLNIFQPKLSLNIIPSLILPIICIIFGLWALELPLKYFIFPYLQQIAREVPAEYIPSFTINIVKVFEVIIGVTLGIYLSILFMKKIIKH